MVLLVALTAAGPFAMQIFIPALPTIQRVFEVNAATAHLVFSVSGFAMAVATLAFGPLADRFGRRPVLIASMVLYIIGSAWATAAPTIEGLIFGRVIQAVGGVAGLVLARTIVRDLFDRDRSAEMIAYLTVGMVIIPMMSPAVGGLLIDSVGWRSNFALPGIIGVLIFVATLKFLPETNPRRDPSVPQHSLWQGTKLLVRNPAFIAYAGQASASMGVFFSFLAGAPYLVQDVMGQPASVYGFWFILVAFGFGVGNFTAARISSRIGLDRSILLGSTLVLTVITLIGVTMLAGHWHTWALFPPMMLVGFGQGFALPNAQAGALSVDPSIAGTASGIGGFAQLGFASLMSQVVGASHNGTPYPMLSVMFLCAVLMLAFMLLPRPIQGLTPTPPLKPHASGH